MANELSTYKYMGFKVVVYPNRIEYKAAMKNVQIIPFRAISGFSRPKFMACLDVQTTDGKKHRLNMNMKDADALTVQISNLL